MSFSQSILKTVLSLYGFAPKGVQRRRPAPVYISIPRSGGR